MIQMVTRTSTAYLIDLYTKEEYQTREQLKHLTCVQYFALLSKMVTV